jgi:hypothetical protein
MSSSFAPATGGAGSLQFCYGDGKQPGTTLPGLARIVQRRQQPVRFLLQQSHPPTEPQISHPSIWIPAHRHPSRGAEQVQAIHRIEPVVRVVKARLDAIDADLPVFDPAPWRKPMDRVTGAAKHIDLHAFHIDFQEVEMRLLIDMTLQKQRWTIYRSN